MKILFLSNVNCSEKSGCYSIHRHSSGLSNSIRFIVEMLKKEGYECAYMPVVDGNDVDREVFNHRPDVVIIEALWVTPSKLKELTVLHPKVKWVIRLHSESPFLSNEGNATEWLKGYAKLNNVCLAANSNRMANDLGAITKKKGACLPNYYHIKEFYIKKESNDSGEVNIGCFGAIRPLKNQYIQAIAAIRFANGNKLHLNFHINCTRKEMGGNQIYENLKCLFKDTPHTLIEHDWLEHKEFLLLVARMDIGMQVSFSETFNIVAADMVVMGVPVVGSKEITWLPESVKADTNSAEDICKKLNFVYGKNINMLKGLHKSNSKAVKDWKEFLN